MLIVNPYIIAPPAAGTIFRAGINIDYAAGTEAGFPLFIHEGMFAADHGIFLNSQADGGDIQIFDKDGATRLPLEVIHFDQDAQEIRAFTRLPGAYSQDDKPIIQVGSDSGPLSQPAVGAAYGRNEVWQDYELVSHDLVDDAAGNYSLTNTGGAVQSSVSGLPARGYDVNYGSASTDKTATGYTANATNRTVSFWHYRHRDDLWGRIFQKGSGDIDNCVNDNGAGGRLGYRREFAGGNGWWAMARPSLDAWAYAAVSHDASDGTNDAEWTLNGAVQSLTVDNNTTGAAAANANEMFVGNESSGGAPWDGMISEFRIAHNVLAAARLLAEYSNMNAPGSFASAEAGSFV